MFCLLFHFLGKGFYFLSATKQRKPTNLGDGGRFGSCPFWGLYFLDTTGICINPSNYFVNAKQVSTPIGIIRPSLALISITSSLVDRFILVMDGTQNLAWMTGSPVMDDRFTGHGWQVA